MIYCRNTECQYNKPCEPFDFQFSHRITPLYKNLVYSCCSLTQPELSDVFINRGDFGYDVVICEECEGVCNKPCLWNESGTCTRGNILVERQFYGDNDLIPTCRCYSRKNISGHMDWSRFPQGGRIDADYAEKINADASKFKMYMGSSKTYDKGHHGSKHESKELPSALEKQAKEREKEVLRDRWETNRLNRLLKRR